MTKTAAIIPARLASTRLPRKLLLDRTGKSLLQHTFEAVKAIRGIDLVAVATGDREIKEAVQRFGGSVILTDPDASTGTERIRWAAKSLPADYSHIINVQGDEPEIDVYTVEPVIMALSQGQAIATMCAPIENRDEFERPSIVKVVKDAQGHALYFSRSPIPYRYGEPFDKMFGLRHVGIYGFQRDVLGGLTTYGVASILDRWEGLEQLRWLELGHKIWVGVTKMAHPGIDVAEDYEQFVQRHIDKHKGAVDVEVQG